VEKTLTHQILLAGKKILRKTKIKMKKLCWWCSRNKKKLSWKNQFKNLFNLSSGFILDNKQ